MKKWIASFVIFAVLIAYAVPVTPAGAAAADWFIASNKGGGEIRLEDSDAGTVFHTQTEAMQANLAPVDITSSNVEIELGEIPYYTDENSGMSAVVSFSNQDKIPTEYGTKSQWDGIIVYMYFENETTLNVEVDKNTDGADWVNVAFKPVPMPVVQGTKLYLSLQWYNGNWNLALNGTILVKDPDLIHEARFPEGKGYIQVGMHSSEIMFPIDFTVTRFNEAAGNDWGIIYGTDNSFTAKRENGGTRLVGDSAASIAVKREPLPEESANILFSVNDFIGYANGPAEGKPQVAWQLDIDFTTGGETRNGYCVRFLPKEPGLIRVQVVNYDSWTQNAWPYDGDYYVDAVDGQKFFISMKPVGDTYEFYLDGVKLPTSSLPPKDFSGGAYVMIGGTAGGSAVPFDLTVYDTGNSGLMLYDNEISERAAGDNKTVTGSFSAYNNLQTTANVTFGLASYSENGRMSAFDAKAVEIEPAEKSDIQAPEIICGREDTVSMLAVDELSSMKPILERPEYTSQTLTMTAGVYAGSAVIRGDMGENTSAGVRVESPSGQTAYANIIHSGGEYEIAYPLDTEKDESGFYLVTVNGNREAAKRTGKFFFADQSLAQTILATANTGDKSAVEAMFLASYPVFNIDLESYSEQVPLTEVYDMIIANRPYEATDEITAVVEAAPLVSQVNHAEADALLTLLEDSRLAIDFKWFDALYSDADRSWALTQLSARKGFTSFQTIRDAFSEFVCLARLNRASADDMASLLKDVSIRQGLTLDDNAAYKSYLSYSGAEKKSIETGLVRKQPFSSRNDFLTKLAQAVAERTKPDTGGNGGSSSGSGSGSRGGSSSTVQLPFTPPPSPAPKDPYQNIKEAFDDISTVSWAYAAISELFTRGIISGSEGKLRPEESITREEFVKIAALAYGLAPFDSESTFSDVPAGSWYAGYLSAAVNAGLVSGQTEDLFGTGQPISRQDAAVIIARMAQQKGLLGNPEAKESFADAEEIAPYAAESVQQLYESGLINGSDGFFHPLDASSRAEVFQMISSYLGVAK